MSITELTAIPNPRRDREYEVILASDSRLLCKADALQGRAEASFEFRYTPGLHCLEARSFGRYITAKLQERPLDHGVLDELLHDVVGCCHPLKASLEVTAQSFSGSIALSAAYP